MTTYSVEVVYVGSASHLRRFKVVDANGKYVPGGLFRTLAEAEAFVATRTSHSAGREWRAYQARLAQEDQGKYRP